MNITRIIAILVTTLLLILTACGGNTPDGEPVSDLPTEMVLPTLTDTPEFTFTPSQTLTPSATLTGTQTATLTPSITFTPSQTITDTPTPTPTPSNTAPYVPGLVDILVETAKASTVLPPEFRPTNTATPVGFVASPTVPVTIISTFSGTEVGTSCNEAPSGGFASIYLASPFVQQQLGCPVPNTVMVGTPAAVQNFQGGQMIWVQGSVNYIYVLFNNGTYQRYVDTWVSGETAPITTPPPSGLFEPVRGFGKVWRDNAFVRDTLGWATDLEASTTANRQEFATGTMLHVITRNDVLVMGGATGTWQPFAGSY